ncbi:MAG: acyl-CoA dehydrogenase, partial [Desulfomonile tiedjei]|nr:acyl-CoA dehydrogenase [Desulfomonile tiedjei]
MLLNPKKFMSRCRDEKSRDMMARTIDFFENKGKSRLKNDDHERVWYADFLDFVKKEK